MPKDEIFIQRVITALKPDNCVLDLGAGEGVHAKQFFEAGAKVVAVDRHAPNNPIPGIEWHTVTVEEYVENLDPAAAFNLIFTRNLIQFLDREWVIKILIPTFKNHLAPKGIIAIRTFFQDPEPPFSKPCASLYTLEDLLPLFTDFTVKYKNQFELRGPDTKGIPRNFYLTDLIVQRV